jgi:hypothetical protein
MTEPPTGSPWGPEFDDRRVHAHHVPAVPPHGHEPEPPFEGPLRALSRAAWQVVLGTGITSLALGILVLVWPGASSSRPASSSASIS